jgi:DNA polymerase III delta prime subunit
MWTIKQVESRLEVGEPVLEDLFSNIWNIPDGVVIGKICRDDNNKFYCLKDVKNRQGTVLNYPLKDLRSDYQMHRRGIYIGANLPDGTEESDIVQATITLSEDRLSLKHNPLSLCTVPKSVSRLSFVPSLFLDELPEDALVVVFQNETSREDLLKIIDSAFLSQYEKAKSQLSEIDEKGKQRESQIEAEIGEWEAILRERKTESEELQGQIDALKARAHEAQNELENLKQQQQRVKTDVKKIENSLKEIDGKHQLLSRIAEARELAEKYGLDDSTEDAAKRISDEPSEKWEVEFKWPEVADHAQAYLASKGLRYSKATIECFLTLLHTHDWVLLAGAPGVGKTSLIRGMAQAIGARLHSIEVRPNWTSPDSLVGFYNSLHGTFEETAFTRAIRKAKVESDRLHFICLDEMNLARPEYYLADLLSLFEDRTRQPFLTLVPPEQLREARTMHSLLQGLDAKDIEARVREERLQRLIAQGSPLEIPSNVRIFGTLNIDETAHYLSPKVLDRSHVLRFEVPPDSKYFGKELSKSTFDNPLKANTMRPRILGANQFLARKDYPYETEEAEKQIAFLTTVAEQIAGVRIDIGGRTRRQTLLFIQQFLQHFGGEKAGKRYEAGARLFAISNKLLPRIHMESGKEKAYALRATAAALRSSLEGLPERWIIKPRSPVEVLEKLAQQAETSRLYVSYWDMGSGGNTDMPAAPDTGSATEEALRVAPGIPPGSTVSASRGHQSTEISNPDSFPSRRLTPPTITPRGAPTNPRPVQRPARPSNPYSRSVGPPASDPFDDDMGDPFAE